RHRRPGARRDRRSPPGRRGAPVGRAGTELLGWRRGGTDRGVCPRRSNRLMALQVFTAGTGGPWESELVGALDRSDHGVTVVRRCVDVSELLAAAATGTGQAALLSADLRRLDGDAVARLNAAGVAVVGLADAGDEQAAERLRRLGVARIVPADAQPEAI